MSLGFIQPRISQVLRVHKDLLLDLFSPSAVQIENHSTRHWSTSTMTLNCINPLRRALSQGVEWVENEDIRVVNEPYITTNNDL